MEILHACVCVVSHSYPFADQVRRSTMYTVQSYSSVPNCGIMYVQHDLGAHATRLTEHA